MRLWTVLKLRGWRRSILMVDKLTIKNLSEEDTNGFDKKANADRKSVV